MDDSIIAVSEAGQGPVLRRRGFVSNIPQSILRRHFLEMDALGLYGHLIPHAKTSIIKRMFSEKEIAYLQSQRLARIATVSSDGKPDVAPVGFTFKSGRFLVGGMDLKRTLKYTNAKATGRAAIVVDDLPSADRPQPRGIKVHGTAQIIQAEGHLGPAEYIEITPERYWSWGIEAPAFDQGKPVMKKVRR